MREVMEEHDAQAGSRRSRNPLVRFQHGFEQALRAASARATGTCSSWRWRTGAPSSSASWPSSCCHSALCPFLGSNFFPDGRFRRDHPARPRAGRHADRGDRGAVRPHRTGDPPDHPARPAGTIVDNIGLPVSGINRAYSNTGGIGPQDGDIYVTLNRKPSRRRPAMCANCATRLPQAFPGSTFSFLPADIISQILNFGAPAPIDRAGSGP